MTSTNYSIGHTLLEDIYFKQNLRTKSDTELKLEIFYETNRKMLDNTQQKEADADKKDDEKSANKDLPLR